ncbi:MAG: hypothetical protein NT142_12330 [Planctomycetota bacterium]|nr:hypothetical protein [Planctomycetota bacterium]
MNPLLLLVLLQNPAPPDAAPKPVGQTRVREKELLEAYKKAKPRLPMPPEVEGQASRVNNGRFRQYYLGPDFQTSGLGGREPDPELILNNTFKVKLFWIASRANNCFY